MLYSFEGGVGTGKTLLATACAYYTPRPVRSNYKILLPNYNDLKPEDLFTLDKPTLVIIDEAYTWLESRTSGRDINLYMSYILFQSRKRGLDIILTDQLISTIDLRYRHMINYVVECEKVKQGFLYSISEVTKYGQTRPMTFLMPWKNAERFFPMYNTMELVSPIDPEMIFNISEDKSSIIKDIDLAKDDLLAKAPAKFYSKGIVADYCLRNQLPKHFVDGIYNAIKASMLEEQVEVPSKKNNKSKNIKRRK